MFDEIEWRPTPGKSNEREGFCPDLPDSYCRFAVQKSSENNYDVILPIIDTAIKLPFETYDDAKAFCVRFLSKNTEAIVRHQFRRQREVVYGYEAKRPLTYYQRLLEKFVEDAALKKIKKADIKGIWKRAS